MTKTWELISMPQGRNVGSDLFISTSWDSLRSRLPDPASSPVRLVNAGSQGPQILPRRWRIGRGADLQNMLPIHIGPLRPSAFPETSGIALPLLSNRRVSDRYGRYKRRNPRSRMIYLGDWKARLISVPRPIQSRLPNTGSSQSSWSKTCRTRN